MLEESGRFSILRKFIPRPVVPRRMVAGEEIDLAALERLVEEDRF